MKKKDNFQKGQSLIETIGAILILTTGLTVLVGVTIYAFSRGAVIQNEVIASNLAREGIDVVRKMRDSNWLSGAASFGYCADIDKECYPNVYRSGYALDDGTYGSNQRYRVQMNNPLNNWQIQGNGNRWDRIRLFTTVTGLYTHEPSGNTATDYARQVVISYITSAPYTATNPAMNVKSVVVWNGRGCTSLPSPSDTSQVNLALTSGAQSFNTPCKVIVEETMTNWKDYR